MSMVSAISRTGHSHDGFLDELLDATECAYGRARYPHPPPARQLDLDQAPVTDGIPGRRRYEHALPFGRRPCRTHLATPRNGGLVAMLCLRATPDTDARSTSHCATIACFSDTSAPPSRRYPRDAYSELVEHPFSSLLYPQ